MGPYTFINNRSLSRQLFHRVECTNKVNVGSEWRVTPPMCVLKSNVKPCLKKTEAFGHSSSLERDYPLSRFLESRFLIPTRLPKPKGKSHSHT